MRKKKEKVKPSVYIRERIEKGELDPAKLSKAGRWVLENPGGAYYRADRKPANR